LFDLGASLTLHTIVGTTSSVESKAL